MERLLTILGLIILSFSNGTARPNILFIAVDDLRPSLGCYGDPIAHTPHIDKLAAQGVQFNRAYCQVAVCNPSRASLMTGQRPDKLGVWTLPIHFREAKPNAITIPQWFRRSGYTAVSHGKIYHNPTPDPQSWSEPIRSLPSLPDPYPEGTREQIRKVAAQLPAKDWRKNSLRPPSTAAPNLPDDQLIDGAQTNLAIEDLKRLAKKEDPFFLAMGYIRPHLAWVAPKKYWDLYDPTTLPVLEEQIITPNTPPYALHNNSELTHYSDLIDFPRPWHDQTISSEKARSLMHGYYACVSYIDAQIGRLLDTVVEEGLADNTIIVLWSDHGWKLGEYRGWGKMTNYEIDARVPLIISAPNLQTQGQKTDSLAELLDLFPTLCDLADVEKPNFIDGTSLAPILNDPSTKVHKGAVNQYYRGNSKGKHMGYALRTDSYRFIEWRDFETGEVTAKELYDHRTEHSETHNIAEEVKPELIEKLTTQLLETHPRKPLSLIPTVHASAEPRTLPTKLTFKNNYSSDVLISTISSKGHRKRPSKRLTPGKKLTYNAKLGGVFVVESVDGSLYQIHSPSYPERTIILEQKIDSSERE